MLKFDMAVRYLYRDINYLGEPESLELRGWMSGGDKNL